MAGIHYRRELVSRRLLRRWLLGRFSGRADRKHRVSHSYGAARRGNVLEPRALIQHRIRMSEDHFEEAGHYVQNAPALAESTGAFSDELRPDGVVRPIVLANDVMQLHANSKSPWSNPHADSERPERDVGLAFDCYGFVGSKARGELQADTLARNVDDFPLQRRFQVGRKNTGRQVHRKARRLAPARFVDVLNRHVCFIFVPFGDGNRRPRPRKCNLSTSS